MNNSRFWCGHLFVTYFLLLINRNKDSGLVQTHANCSGKTLQDQVRPGYPISHGKEEMAAREFCIPESPYCSTDLCRRDHTGNDYLQL
jgi:hypothetical protein